MTGTSGSALSNTSTAAPAQPGTTVRLTVGQAVVRFLGRAVLRARWSCAASSLPVASASSATATWPGIGQALLQAELDEPGGLCLITRAATSRPWCTSPPAMRASRTGWRPSPSPPRSDRVPSNMLTGAALATVNRIPVLLLPSRHLRHQGGLAGAAGAGTALRLRRLGQRRLPSAVQVLRPGVAAGAVAGRAARRHAGVDRPGRDRQPRRSRLPEDVQAEAFDWPVELFARAGLADHPAAARAGGASAEAAEIIRGRPAPDHRLRRRRHLRRGQRGAARPRRRHRHPDRRDPSGQGFFAVRPSAESAARSAPPAITAANDFAAARRCGHRYRHPLLGFHHGLQAPSSRTRPSSSSTSTWPAWMRSSRPASAGHRGRQAGASGPAGSAGRLPHAPTNTRSEATSAGQEVGRREWLPRITTGWEPGPACWPSARCWVRSRR